MDLEEILETYTNTYEAHVEKLYKHISDHHLDAFPVLRFKDYLNIIYITIDKEVFGSGECVIIFDNAEHLSGEYEYTDIIDDETLIILMDSYKNNRINKLLEIKFPELSSRSIYTILTFSLNLIDHSGNINSGMIESRARRNVESDYNSWRRENKTQVSQYNHDNISSHSHLDYGTLIKKFESKDFKEDFKYQMDQAEECYKRHLYLPAAATLSVALETILADLCKKEKIKIKNSTEMNHLGEKLVERGIINYRLGKRIDITYSLRNSLAHTNKGEVSKDDCSIILSCIRTIIEEHY